MKILILGAYESCNLGDGVICQCVANRLQSRFPDARIEIRDLLDRDRSSPRKEPVPDALRSRWLHELARDYASRLGWDKTLAHEESRVKKQLGYIDHVCGMDCDGVVFAGGQLLMDRYALFLERYVAGFGKRGIPMFFNACGTGPSPSAAIGRRLKKTLADPNVRFISCRDHVDLVNDRYMTGEKRVVFAADPALWTAEVYGIQKDAASDTIGLGVMYPWGMDVKRVLRFWRGVIRCLDQAGKKWKIFTNGDPADITFAKMILETLPWGEEHILPRDTEPEKLVKTIAGFSGIISFRLHSHIIAICLDIPTVCVVWDDKLPEFFGRLGIAHRCRNVGSKPEQVLPALEQAAREGYDRTVLEKLARDSLDLLVCALCDAFPEEAT